jgi:hypothetical protein
MVLELVSGQKKVRERDIESSAIVNVTAFMGELVIEPSPQLVIRIHKPSEDAGSEDNMRLDCTFSDYRRGHRHTLHKLR